MIETVNPSTGVVIEKLPYASPATVDRALTAAHENVKRWNPSDVGERAQLLRAVAAAFRAQAESLAATAVREMGKPIVQARAEVEKCAWALEYFAEHAGEMLAPQDVAASGERSYVAFRPLGAILAVMPWNFPYWQVVRAAAPAIMAGNAMLLKHADATTRCALEIERVIREAGAPDGAFATLLVHHDEADRLIADPRIAAVTLTGSERAGVAVASAAGAALKKCVLELGGSDAFVVLEDADLNAAAKTAVTARFQNNGQSCIAAKRFIVVEPVYDAFLERFVELTSDQCIGDPMDDRTQIGPCAREDLRSTLHAQVTGSIGAGATLACGGKALAGEGYYYAPTILGDVVPGMRAFDEEVFGPAAAVVRAADEDAAIALANASSFGLGFSIWTGDVARAERIAARVEAGSVFVNGMVASDPRLPFGGVKKSGYGRELSRFGIHEFTNVQTVWIGPARATQSSQTPAE